ncbi:unnamed protein product [Schistocephalus solidus]|uniref:Endo/exonuclease/phosphatase domain-containing protein n=1 Tax=Schistocephalus solidus TaxID=70667 RepID=A0A183SN54_SCHSO|nr:unnamed protein product [Schistocephalus solidus]
MNFQGGGGAMYVNINFIICKKPENATNDMEAIWLTSNVQMSQSLFAMTFYRSSKTDTDADTCLQEKKKEIDSQPNVVLIRDFNAPSIQWIELKAKFSSYETMRSPSIQDILFLEVAVVEEQKTLTLCKPPGSYDIPAKLIFEHAGELAKSLFFMGQKSLDTGIIPTDKKTAHITDLYINGSSGNATNCRPVSLTFIC